MGIFYFKAFFLLFEDLLQCKSTLIRCHFSHKQAILALISLFIVDLSRKWVAFPC